MAESKTTQLDDEGDRRRAVGYLPVKSVRPIEAQLLRPGSSGGEDLRSSPHQARSRYSCNLIAALLRIGGFISPAGSFTWLSLR